MQLHIRYPRIKIIYTVFINYDAKYGVLSFGCQKKINILYILNTRPKNPEPATARVALRVLLAAAFPVTFSEGVSLLVIILAQPPNISSKRALR